LRENAKIGVLILAAGSSSRLGYPKQLVEFRGVSLLQHTINIAEEIDFLCKILVLGAGAEKIDNEIDKRNFNLVFNANWKEGMGTSIAKGISEALKVKPQLDHILILLSDQPFVTIEKIQELIQVQLDSKTQATLSEYAGVVGVPAIFSKELFSDLMNLKGEQGAKKLLSRKELSFGTVKSEGGNFDVDTAADVELLRQKEKE